jgi:maleylacetate reductase
MRFVHDAVGARVIFGNGRRDEVAGESERLGSRPMIVSDEVAALVADEVIHAVGRTAAATIDRVRQHVPVEDAHFARDLARESGADCVVAIGGGSTVGLAKAIALTEKLPILAVPTTYAGSEMTPVWGMTEGGVKRTGRAQVVAPRTVIYDPVLTVSLPASITAASGLNAVAHCVDALWAPGRSPLTDLMAEQGIAMLARSLPGAVARGDDLLAREGALAGSWLAGATFAIAGSSLHHKLCHVLGGRFDLPHAETHAIVLPHVTALATAQLPEAQQLLARALEASDPVEGLVSLSERLGAPTRLADLGVSEAEVLAVAEEIDLSGLATPFPLTREQLRAMLQQAVRGPVSR